METERGFKSDPKRANATVVRGRYAFWKKAVAKDRGWFAFKDW